MGSSKKSIRSQIYSKALAFLKYKFSTVFKSKINVICGRYSTTKPPPADVSPP
jgi:hypothetical protein